MRPGSYVVCWCFGDCAASDFLTTVGPLQLSGPERGHEHRCARGAWCRGVALEGVELRATDRLRVLVTCGEPAGLSGFPGDGEAVARTGSEGREFDLAEGALLAAAGRGRTGKE